MAIIIKGMKKPQRCAGCYMFLHGLDMDGTPWQECAATDRDPGDTFGSCMPDWCPISKLPERHGRLIDANAALKLLRNLGSRDYRREKGTIMDAMKMLSYDEYTPSIIPASE